MARPPWRRDRTFRQRLRRVLPLFPAAARRAGGWLPLLPQLGALYLHEGKGGVTRHLLNAQPEPVNLTDSFTAIQYAQWRKRYDHVDDAMRARLRKRATAFAEQPLISVLMPTYNSKPEWLEAAIASVRTQIYPHWELCIADDASTDANVRPLLERHAAEDPRIKLVFRGENGHICAASNSALEIASGTWTALLDHDDLLSEHALFWVTEAISRHPDACMIYSDEDKCDGAGKRFDAYFKPDWNIDLFYSQNLFSHLGVYRTGLIRRIGGFRPGLEGSQDYDLALRCIEHVAAGEIVHIPRVLYHWRAHAGSTSESPGTKPYAMLAGERALNEHFVRTGVKAAATQVGYGYRVQYALPRPVPLVSIIIPTRNNLTLLRRCVSSICRHTPYASYEIVIVDNGSDDPPLLAYLDELQSASSHSAQKTNVRVLRDARPFNFSALNNAAVKATRGDVIALLNDDIEVLSPDWLTEMVSHAMRPGVGAVGARLLYPDGTVQHVGTVLGMGGCAGHIHRHLPRDMPGYFCRAVLAHTATAVTAACMVIRKELYEAVGGLNETDLPIAYNDVDFCLRLREAGYRSVMTPFAELIHHESASRGADATPQGHARLREEAAYMQERWGDLLQRDPTFSPNLSLDEPQCRLAFPPRLPPA